MPAWAAQLIYSLLLKVAGGIYDKFMINRVDSKLKEQDKQRRALLKAISKAENEEDRASYSIILSRLSNSR